MANALWGSHNQGAGVQPEQVALDHLYGRWSKTKCTAAS